LLGGGDHSWFTVEAGRIKVQFTGGGRRFDNEDV
jgi:hypothetical protein